jgi:hypothetical protein
MFTDLNVGSAAPSYTTGWAQNAYNSVSFYVPSNWKAGRIWARRDCNFGSNPGPNSCIDGGCNGGLVCDPHTGTVSVLKTGRRGLVLTLTCRVSRPPRSPSSRSRRRTASTTMTSRSSTATSEPSLRSSMSGMLTSMQPAGTDQQRPGLQGRGLPRRPRPELPVRAQGPVRQHRLPRRLQERVPDRPEPDEQRLVLLGIAQHGRDVPVVGRAVLQVRGLLVGPAHSRC